MKIQKLILASFFAILVLTTLVSAWGVSSPYWSRGAREPSPLKTTVGETEIVDLNIQNMVGNEDITVKATILEGSEIATLEQDTYTLKAGTETIAPLKIRAPETIGTYKVKAEFKTVTPGAGGGIVMGTGMTISFDVIVSEKIEKPGMKISTGLIVAIILIIVIIVVILIFIRKKRRK